MHAVGSEGSNFDLTSCGEFSESVEDVKRYQVEAQKYETNEKPLVCLKNQNHRKRQQAKSFWINAVNSLPLGKNKIRFRIIRKP